MLSPQIAQSTPDLDTSSINNNSSGKLKAKAKRFSPSMKIKNIKGKIKSNLKFQDNNDITTINDCKTLSSAEKLLRSGIDPVAAAANSDNLTDLSLKLERQETTIQEYSILEKCIKQYEIFFQVYLASQVLNISNKSRKTVNMAKNVPPITICSVSDNNLIVNDLNDPIKYSQNVIIEDDCSERICEINNLFDTLKINEISRSNKLHNLLHKTIMKRGSTSTSDNNSDTNDYKDCFSSSEKLPNDNIDVNNERLSIRSMANVDDPLIDKAIQKLMNLQINESLRNCVKLASALLIEMSTFPNYNQNMMISTVPIDIPVWLKVLILIGCYCKLDKELQICAIQTLFDLIGLLKSQMEHTTNPGVTYVVMLPLLKSGHVSYLESKTRTIQVSRKFTSTNTMFFSKVF